MTEIIPISETKSLCIGMMYTEVLNLLGNEDIRGTNDMKNGYKWLDVWITPFSNRMVADLVFNKDKLEMVIIYPQINDSSETKSWNDANERNMKKDYKVCKKWYSKYKKHLPHSTEVFKDERNWEAGICIR